MAVFMVLMVLEDDILEILGLFSLYYLLLREKKAIDTDQEMQNKL